MATREVHTFSINQCIVADTDDDDKPILWQKLSQLQGCASTDKPTTAMPSQAPTYRNVIFSNPINHMKNSYIPAGSI